MLKRNAQAANSLTPQKQAPSNVLADTVGMTIAALAMVKPLMQEVINRVHEEICTLDQFAVRGSSKKYQ